MRVLFATGIVCCHCQALSAIGNAMLVLKKILAIGLCYVTDSTEFAGGEARRVAGVDEWIKRRGRGDKLTGRGS